jgi:peptidoglycan/xylan/chitin deacetylase (PgdA/CDA1 family)
VISTALDEAAGLVTRALGSNAVTTVARLANNGRLPVLAYHDVTDPATFTAHLDFLQDNYRPVSGSEVIAATRDGARLPRRAIWITFDDARPGVFSHALPLLAERKVPATVFTCPGVVDTDQPYWWQTLELALAAERPVVFRGRAWSDVSIITQLKSVSDAERRATVARVADDLAASGRAVAVPQASSVDLRRWLEAGLDLGNHTWNHPCLDTCDPDEQRKQIVAADDYLRDVLDGQPRLFAYPNGNTAEPSRQVLRQLGYHVAALFDHRLSRLRGPEVSRLRIDADAPIRRLAAITSGAHPAAYTVARRVRAARRTVGASA